MSSKKIDSSQLEKTAGGEKTTAPAGIAGLFKFRWTLIIN